MSDVIRDIFRFCLTLIFISTFVMFLAVQPLAAGDGGGPEASGPDVPSESNADANEQDETDEELDPAIKGIIEKFGAWEDESVIARVESIRDELIAAADENPKLETIEFLLLDEDSINAFALADGHIFLFRGLIERTETDDQLASIMAHEMTHVLHGHHERGMDTITAVQLLSILGAIAAEEQEPAIAGQMISAALIESYGRDAEVDADLSGADMMIDAGYDPLGMVEFFSYMEGLERRRPQMMGNYFTIHPHANERIENLREHLAAKGIEVPDNFYRLHLALDLACKEVEGHFECDVFVGDEVAFVLAGEDEGELIERAYIVIHSLREVFSKGLRDYEVRSREVDGTYCIEAKRSILVSVTASDEDFLDGDALSINTERLENIKYILWQYYTERHI